MVGCFGFNDPLRQSFKSISSRPLKEKIPNNTNPHLVQAQQALALLLSKLVSDKRRGRVVRAARL